MYPRYQDRDRWFRYIIEKYFDGTIIRDSRKRSHNQQKPKTLSAVPGEIATSLQKPLLEGLLIPIPSHQGDIFEDGDVQMEQYLF